jgi:hypothetical protein
VAASNFAVEIQWHAPDLVYAAALLRDGQPWILGGALVGMGGTPGAAVDDLAGIGRHLVIEGENMLTGGPISLADREWLFNLLDPGPDLNDDMYAALQAARTQTSKGE